MPTYISGARGFSLSNMCCNDNSLDRNSAIFFNNLATKLLEMTKTIEKRMEDLSNKVCTSGGKGFILMSIETPVMAVSVGGEYIEYVRRYGPPEEGIFDETKLKNLRIELGISEDAHTI